MQILSLLVMVLLYAAAVCAQFTIGERLLRPLGAAGLVLRTYMSIVHAVLAYGALLGIGITLSVIVHGDYRRGILGPHSHLVHECGAVVGLLTPWLPMCWRRSEKNQ